VRSSRTRATLSTGAPTETVAIFGAGGLGHLALQYARIACATASCTTTSTSSSPWRCGPAPTWSWPASACRCIALLTRAGFSAPDALHFYRAPFGCPHGHVLNELQELAGNPDETDGLLRLGLHRLPIAEFPVLRGRPRPVRLRRSRRTRTRRRHPPHRPGHHSDPQTAPKEP